jgi:hypothetical protein
MIRFLFHISRSHSALVFIFLAFGLYSCSVLQKPSHPLEATKTGIKRGSDSLRFQLIVWKNMMPGPSMDRSVQLSLEVMSEGLDLSLLSLDSVHVVSERPMNAPWHVRFSAPTEKQEGIWTYGATGKGLLWRGSGSVRAKFFGSYDATPFVHDGWNGRIQITH